MKVSIPKLISIKPKQISYATDAERHSRESLSAMIARKQNKMIGYALVAIYERTSEKPQNYGYEATWHCSDTSIHHSDIADVVRNKLILEAATQEAIRRSGR